MDREWKLLELLKCFLLLMIVKGLKNPPVGYLHDNNVNSQHGSHQQKLDSRRKFQKNGNGNETENTS